MPSKKSNVSAACGIILLIGTLGFIMPMFIVYTIQYAHMSNYEAVPCNITIIEYPTEMPTDDNLHLWTDCDCGRRCMSRHPCIKMYSSLAETNMIEDTYHAGNSDCTITETICSQGEDPYYAHQSLNQSITLAESYINSETTCYVNPNSPSTSPIYLNYDDSFGEFIGFTVVFGIMTVCGVFLTIKFLGNNQPPSGQTEEIEINELA